MSTLSLLQRACSMTNEKVALPMVKNAQADKLQILVADDDRAVRDFTALALRRQGYEVVAVEDGQAAVETWPTGSEHFDLVILDINMPRLDGYQAYQRLRHMHPEGCFLFVSGGPNEDVREKLVREGNPEFLAKPFGPQKLIETVRKLAGRGRKN